MVVLTNSRTVKNGRKLKNGFSTGSNVKYGGTTGKSMKNGANTCQTITIVLYLAAL